MELNPLPSLGDRIMDRFGKLRLMMAVFEEENDNLRALVAEAGKEAPPSRYKAGAAEAMMRDIQKMLNERQVFVDKITAFLDKLDEDIPFDNISEAETRVQPPDNIKLDDLEGGTQEKRQKTQVLPGRKQPVDMTSKELGPDDLTPPSGTETDEDGPGTEVDVLDVDSDPDLSGSDDDWQDLDTKADPPKKGQDESQVAPLDDADDGDKTEVDAGEESQVDALGDEVEDPDEDPTEGDDSDDEPPAE